MFHHLGISIINQTSIITKEEKKNKENFPKFSLESTISLFFRYAKFYQKCIKGITTHTRESEEHKEKPKQ